MLNTLKNIIKYGFIKTIYFAIKRSQYLKIHSNGIILGFGTNLNNVSIGKNVFIGNYSSLLNSKIGDYSYLNANVKIRDTVIGKFCFCSIASRSNLTTYFIRFYYFWYGFSSSIIKY